MNKVAVSNRDCHVQAKGKRVKVEDLVAAVHADAVGRARASLGHASLEKGPGMPRHAAVNRVAGRRLVDLELVGLAGEAEPAAANAPGEREEHCRSPERRMATKGVPRFRQV